MDPTDLYTVVFHTWHSQINVELYMVHGCRFVLMSKLYVELCCWGRNQGIQEMTNTEHFPLRFKPLLSLSGAMSTVYSSKFEADLEFQKETHYHNNPPVHVVHLTQTSTPSHVLKPRPLQWDIRKYLRRAFTEEARPGSLPFKVSSETPSK